eukprot:CAMPEP_0196996092 /NCGR_PEP_ID=MMETSP1380-20130617/2066_1 /TAXON_ID=5936 /ORGANISM="Euplotes crassus, Strain CT5" /LENGTH=97 /DNA_ID=CAMNT_0042411965 /DNA_START=494 /DNA_END=787 /DNA_ORIENTATION=+
MDLSVRKSLNLANKLNATKALIKQHEEESHSTNRLIEVKIQDLKYDERDIKQKRVESELVEKEFDECMREYNRVCQEIDIQRMQLEDAQKKVVRNPS